MRAEWGFTSVHEPLLLPDAEESTDTTQTVGCSETELLQKVIDLHGGIDWDMTLNNLK